MDGFKENEEIIVIGATNLPGSLDKAILRPGRFDKIINIPLPNKQGRINIFKLYLKRIKYDTHKLSPEILAQ